jgi:signal transduction histidine kinase
LTCALLVAIGFSTVGATAQSTVGLEGTVDAIRAGSKQQLELSVVSGTNRVSLMVENAGGNAPVLSSRIHASAKAVSPNQNGIPTFNVSGLDQVRFLTGFPLPLATNIAGLHRLGSLGQHIACVAQLRGLVLGASSGRGTFALQDGTGVALFEMPVPARFVSPGQEIMLEGNCLVEGDRVLLRDPPVVDNNDIHNMFEKSGAIYLSAGKHPLRLAWFNQEFPYGLEVYFQGPDLPRQKIPDSALFRRETDPANGGERWVNGLNYVCVEGDWLRVPDFDRLDPVKQGTVANFDTSVFTRVNDVGLQFSGSVEVPRDGIYTFTTISDDGSLLFIDEKPPMVEVTGANALPAPTPIAVRQSLRADQDDFWAETEGTVTFASERAGMLELDLSADAGRMRVELADSSGSSPQLLLNSRVRVTGICVATHLADGQIVAGRLLVPGVSQIELLEVPTEQWNGHPVVAIRDLAGLNISPGTETIVHARGKIQSHSDGSLVVNDGTGSVLVSTIQTPPQNEDSLIEVLGRWNRVETNVGLQSAVYREITDKSREEASALPTLVTVEQIKSLTREESQRGYPVKIRGVITAVLDSGFFIHDATRSIYARWQPPTDPEVPRVGDYWELEGHTFAEFAPNIQATRATHLGTGILPEPLRPAWDQLINGSLDTDYIEVQGIITSVAPDEVTLLTRAGKISLNLPNVQPQELRRDADGLVRVRGCVVPVRDIHTQQVVPGQMRLVNASIALDEPPPSDLFSIPLKHAADLLLFDLRAGALQRVKVRGQIVHKGDGQLFLMDGGDGLRVIPKSMSGLRVGDLVEAVGFADLGGPSPMVREAVVRRTGDMRLPDAVLLPPNPPLNRKYDATLVRVQARLSAINRDPAEEILELQSGTRGFVARLNTHDGLLSAILPGSLLELTGVYAGQGSDLASGRVINSFDLLLNSATDVQVLARPSWWTVRHTLTFLGGMAFVFLAALVWIALLRRQVEERSNQLAVEIRRHENTERRRELEAERIRIARDLHDDLGATLTQIRFLSALESRDAQLPGTTRGRMEQVSQKSNEMVASLDEIVWAVNPANDSLPNLANYLCHFAEEFFHSTPIRCRLDVDDNLPAVALTSEVRHNLYLAVREALNNIAKHSQATEVWLRIHSREPGWLRLAIEDNGHGFNPLPGAPGGDGLANMRQRMEKIGGRFEYETRSGAGVVCRLFLPIDVSASPQSEA